MQYLIALEPPIPVAERLIVAQEELEAPLRHLGYDARFTGPEQLRMTLARIDGAESLDLTRVRDGLRTIAATTGLLAMALQGLRAIPGETTPRLLAACAVQTDAIAALQRRIGALLAGCGIAEAPGPWEPLIVVARLSTSSPAHPIDPVLARYAELPLGSGGVRELALFRSDRRARAGRAEVVDRLELGTGR